MYNFDPAVEIIICLHERLTALEVGKAKADDNYFMIALIRDEKAWLAAMIKRAEAIHASSVEG